MILGIFNGFPKTTFEIVVTLATRKGLYLLPDFKISPIHVGENPKVSGENLLPF